MGTPRQHHEATRECEPLRVPVLLDLGSSWLRVDCLGISLDGIRVECEPLPSGDPVELYMELPTRVAIEARARVVGATGGHVTLRFIALDAETQRAITTFCRASGLQRRISGTFQLAIPDTVVLS